MKCEGNDLHVLVDITTYIMGYLQASIKVQFNKTTDWIYWRLWSMQYTMLQYIATNGGGGGRQPRR